MQIALLWPFGWPGKFVMLSQLVPVILDLPHQGPMLSFWPTFSSFSTSESTQICPPMGEMTPGKGSLCAWKVSPLTTTTTTFWSPSLPIYGLLLSVFGPRWPICAAGDAPEGFRASSPITPLTPKLNGGENWYPMCIDEVPNNKKQSVTKLASASVLITYLSTGIWWCDDSFPPQIPWIYTIYNEIRSP